MTYQIYRSFTLLEVIGDGQTVSPWLAGIATEASRLSNRGECRLQVLITREVSAPQIELYPIVEGQTGARIDKADLSRRDRG